LAPALSRLITYVRIRYAQLNSTAYLSRVMSAARSACFCLLPLLYSVAAEPGNCEATEGSHWQEIHGQPAKALMQAFTKARQPTLLEHSHESSEVPAGDLNKFGGGNPSPAPASGAPASGGDDLEKKMGGGNPQAQPEEAYVNPYEVKDSQVEEEGVLEVHDGVAGDAAELNDDGFEAVKQENNKVEMEHFIRRLIANRSASVCDYGSLMGLVHYYFKQESGNSFDRLNEELDHASNTSCPWVGTRKNNNCSTDHSVGANASIDEPGYKQVKKANCFAMMKRYIRRVAGTNGYHICNEGGLTGLVHFYFRPGSDGNYSWLVQEITDSSTKECPWVVKNDLDCPKFLDKGKCSGPPTPAIKPHVFVDEKEDLKANFTDLEDDIKASATKKANASERVSANVTARASANASTKTSANASANASVKMNTTATTSQKSSSNATAPVAGNSSTLATLRNAASSNASSNSSTTNASSTAKTNSSTSASSTVKSNSSSSASSTVKSNSSSNASSTVKSDSSASASDDKVSTMSEKLLDENDFKDVKEDDDKEKMAAFVRKLVAQKGYTLCLEGGMQGMVHFYWKKDSNTTFMNLEKEIENAKTSNCPWALKKGSKCPTAEACKR